ncbi:MAG: hypothetical protein AAF581_15970 [Planctomycetota bacterium]
MAFLLALVFLVPLIFFVGVAGIGTCVKAVDRATQLNHAARRHPGSLRLIPSLALGVGLRFAEPSFLQLDCEL